MWLVRVELPWACFGLEVSDDGWIIQAAPIAGWTVGKRGRQVVAHYRSRGGRVSWQQVPHRLSYAGHPLTGSVAELHAAIDALDADTVPESYYQKVLARFTWRPPVTGVPLRATDHRRSAQCSATVLPILAKWEEITAAGAVPVADAGRGWPTAGA
jgi:hypothetical protein